MFFLHPGHFDSPYAAYRPNPYNFSGWDREEMLLQARLEAEERQRRKLLERRRIQAEEEAFLRRQRRKTLESQQNRRLEIERARRQQQLQMLHGAAVIIQRSFRAHVQRAAAIRIQSHARARAGVRIASALRKLQRIDEKFRTLIAEMGPETFTTEHCEKQALVFVESVMPLVLQVDAVTGPQVRGTRKALVKSMNTVMDAAELRANELRWCAGALDREASDVEDGFDTTNSTDSDYSSMEEEEVADQFSSGDESQSALSVSSDVDSDTDIVMV